MARNQIVKLRNGDTLLVRTGVLQGVGPIGPRGLRGDEGPQGPQGNDGPTGPMGAIAAYLTDVRLASAQPVATSTDFTVPFATVAVDELAAQKSTTSYQPSDVGDYEFTVQAEFSLPADGGDGLRSLELREIPASGSPVVLAKTQLPPVPNATTFLQLSTTVRTVAGRTYVVVARHSDSLSVAINTARMTIARSGAGGRGPEGPQGGVGPIGPQGGPGPQGNPGNANSGFSSYRAMRP